MERAGRIIARSKSARNSLPPEELARAAWPAAVGKKIAGRTRAVSVVNGRLIVEVDDALWRKNLEALEPQIRKNLADLMGAEAPKIVLFRLGVPRIPPRRVEVSEAKSGFSARDEADGIMDPVLGRIYRLSRRKAGA